MSTDDVVIVQDDIQRDSDIVVIDISKESSKEVRPQNNDTIILDDDVIEIIDLDRHAVNKEIKDHLKVICSQDRLVGELIEKYLDLENSGGMLRIIHRLFLPLYNKIEDGYRDSDDFKKMIKSTLDALKTHPHHKYSHLKTMCEVMKRKAKDRNKVQFTTLSTTVTAKPENPSGGPRRRKRRKRTESTPKKQQVHSIIEIDDSSAESTNNDPVPTSTPGDLETTVKDDDLVVLGEDPEKPAKEIVPESGVAVLDDGNTSNLSNKENDSNYKKNRNIVRNTNAQEKNTFNNSNSLLVQLTTITTEQKIERIEKAIEYCKKMIDKLEVAEVTSDAENSPYIQCEKMKAQLVNLYKELCTLTGDAPVKKREVRFTAMEGHLQTPVKILENFINENIGSNGSPNLPDFVDVVKCVTVASKTGQLGWNRQRILREARALFTYCGQALQKNRKKREWRYMLGRVNSQLDEDPAEKDAELMARLEANRRIAVKKESDLLEQFVKMEQNPDSIPNNFEVEEDCSDEEIENRDTTHTDQLHYEHHHGLNVENNNVNRLETVKFDSNCARNGFITNLNGFVTGGHQNFVDDTVNDFGHKTPEIGLVNATGANTITNSTLYASSHEKQTTKDILLDETVNVSNQDHTEKENTTCTIEDGESIQISGVDISHESGIVSSNHLESNEHTFMDFVNKRKKVEIEKKRAQLPRSTPLVIKDPLTKDIALAVENVYSIASKQVNMPKASGPPDNLVMDNASGSVPQNTDAYSIADGKRDTMTLCKDSTNNNKMSMGDVVSDTIKNMFSIECNNDMTSHFKENSSVSENIGVDNREPTKDCVDGSKETNLIGKGSMSNENTATNILSIDTELNTSIPETETSDSAECEMKEVKVEVSDLLKDMQSFGDNFTATVFDIEDPFLVIEILDSSDESDNDSDT